MANAPTPKLDEIASDLRKSRDDSLAALQVAIDRVEHEIATTDQVGPFLKRLADRDDALVNEAAALRAAATEAVLALPEVMQAATALTSVSQRIQKVAQRLPAAKDVLATTAATLSLGQQFVDLIVNAQKKSS
jgi:hypothetical protein